MKYFISFFLRGILVLTPLCISIYVLIWFFNFVENLAKNGMQNTLSLGFYFPGLGIICAVVIITLIGIVMSSIIAQRLHAFLQRIIAKLPILKTIYFAVDDFMDFFAGSTENSETKKVVLVQFTGGLQLVGILTNDQPESVVHESIADTVAVYLPMSYQMGGYTVFVPRTMLTETTLSVEEAMKLSMTGWIKKSEIKI